jgi:hypothetical protein
MNKDLTREPGNYMSSAVFSVMQVPMIPKNKSEQAVKEFLEQCDFIAMWCGGQNEFRNRYNLTDTSIDPYGAINIRLYYDEANDSMSAREGQYIVMDSDRDLPTVAISEWELDREFKRI